MNNPMFCDEEHACHNNKKLLDEQSDKQSALQHQKATDHLNFNIEMDHFRPGCAAATTASTVELSVSCRGLLDMDTFSKSDPVCVLFCKDFGRDSWFEFGRTEVVDNNLNPDFVKKFVLSYFFEERQCLRFELYDVDSNSMNLKNHDFLGRTEVTLGEIVSSGKLEKPLQGPKPNAGKIIVRSEEQQACKEEVMMQFCGKKLDKKDWFGKSDPFLAFYKVNEDGSFTICHKTEVIKNTLNPTWKPMTVPVRVFGGDYNRSILIKCFDWNQSGKEDLIGEFQTNLQDLSQGPGERTTYELINHKLKQKKGAKYTNSGRIILSSFLKRNIITFMDFILAGTQLNCTIAIDFTASNGSPLQPSSLHYIHPNFPNHYGRALQAVGEIIQDYDSDKLFPVLGFGARLPPDGRVSHEFFVNGHPDNPFCNGIQGVMEAYHRCIQQVQLYGPTNFAPVINHVAKFAAANRNGSEYFILLILTDGVITDMPQTKQAIVEASSLPLSIIIVGIGNAEFDAMEELDGDDDGAGRLSFRGTAAQRDIVQFVPFRDFMKGNNPADLQVSQARLAKEVLAEIPEQFLSYMKVNNIAPGSWGGGGERPGRTQPPMAPTPHEMGRGASEAPPPYPGI